MKSSAAACILVSVLHLLTASRLHLSRKYLLQHAIKTEAIAGEGNLTNATAATEAGTATETWLGSQVLPTGHFEQGILIATALALAIAFAATAFAARAGVCCFRPEKKEVERYQRRFETASEDETGQVQSFGKASSQASTSGDTKSINEEFLSLALPNIVSNMSTPLIGLVDSFVAGHLGSATLNAVAVGVATFNLLLNMFVFLRKGTTGLAAQANGAKNFQEVRATAARSIAMGLLIGCLLVIFRGPLMTAVFAWQKPPEYAYNECVQYYYARMWGSPFALANFAVQGFLNGMKRSRQVLCQQVTLNVANAAFCLLLASNIGPLHLGAAGIGHAASIANLVAFFNGMVQVYQCLHGLDEPEPGEWSIGQIFKADPLKEMFANAGAITLRSLCLTGTQTSITAVAARMTTPEHPYLAANLLLMQLHMLFAMGSDGFSNAAEALVGEAIGRKDVRRMYRVVKAACKWALGIACFFSLLWLSLGRFFFEQMTDAATRDTSNEACHYLLWLVFAQPFAVWAFLMDGFFVGATLAKEMLYSMIFATLGFAITVYILVGKAVNFPQLGPFPLNSGNNGLWLSFYSFLVYRSLSLLAQWKSIEVKCTPNL